jgi:hypothetical protein
MASPSPAPPSSRWRASSRRAKDYDSIDDVTEHKFYRHDVGLVRETFASGGSLDLVELRR